MYMSRNTPANMYVVRWYVVSKEMVKNIILYILLIQPTFLQYKRKKSARKLPLTKWLHKIFSLFDNWVYVTQLSLILENPIQSFHNVQNTITSSIDPFYLIRYLAICRKERNCSLICFSCLLKYPVWTPYQQSSPLA